jgi:hypothetical protein
VIASFAAACGTLELNCSSTGCTQDERDGLVITVRDGRSGAPLCDVAVVAFDGAYQENLTDFGVTSAQCRYVGAAERPGNYRVQISRPGYTTTEVSDLMVAKGDCHIGPAVMRTIDLQPDPNGLNDAGAE